MSLDGMDARRVRSLDGLSAVHLSLSMFLRPFIHLLCSPKRYANVRERKGWIVLASDLGQRRVRVQCTHFCLVDCGTDLI